MNRLLVLALAVTVSSLLGACAPGLKSYADPTYRKVMAKQLTPLNPPQKVRIEVQFKQQGEPKPDSDLRLRGHVERALAASGVLTPDPLASSVLRVVVNNVGDMSEARKAGIKSGLSFGLAGSIVADEYQFNIVYTDAAGKKKDVFSRHIMRTAVGDAALPAGVEPRTPSVAFGQIVEDAVVAAIDQWQEEHVIGGRP